MDNTSTPSNAYDLVADLKNSSAYSRYLFPYAFVASNELQNFVQAFCVREDVQRLPKILEEWQKLQTRVRALVLKEAQNNLPDSNTPSPIPNHLRSTVNEMTNTIAFQQTFARSKVSFEMVEIDKLIAAQRTIDLDYVDVLLEQIPLSPTEADLIKICLSPKTESAPVNYLETGQNTHVFTSVNEDLRFLGVRYFPISSENGTQYAPGGVPVATITAFVGFGAPQINVYRVNRRLILSNGFHRVYALRARGVKIIPVVVQQIENSQLEFPERLAHLPKEYLLETPRPVLLKDFFDKDFTLIMRAKKRRKVITIAIGAEQIEIPI